MDLLKKGMFFGQRAHLDRLYALTDGVYAIVITLLVLELKVPEIQGLSEAQLIDDLVGQIPKFLAYIISFFLIALFWMRNHWILKPLKDSNEVTFWLQFFHLLFISLTPYTASLVGRYEEDPIAVVLFSGSFGLAGLSLLIIHRYVVTRKEYHGEGVTKEWTNPKWLVIYPGPIFALVSICLSFINPTGALLVWFIAPFWAFVVLRRKD